VYTLNIGCALELAWKRKKEVSANMGAAARESVSHPHAHSNMRSSSILQDFLLAWFTATRSGCDRAGRASLNNSVTPKKKNIIKRRQLSRLAASGIVANQALSWAERSAR
jgi:hypothetical protein